MSLNRSQQHQLHRIESRLYRSDPHLAAMLAVFGRLSVGQRMPAWEQIATSQGNVRQATAMIAKALAIIVAALGLLAGAIRFLLTAIVAGSRSRPQRTARQRTGHGINGRPDPADR